MAFLYQFKIFTGLPPHAWLIQFHLHRAKPLLKRGESIALVADLCGFSDQSHFNRHFKKAMGVTPMQYMISSLCLTALHIEASILISWMLGMGSQSVWSIGGKSMSWAFIFLLAGIVFFNRFVFLEPKVAIRFPVFFERMLKYSVPCLLTAICIPIIFYDADEWQSL